MLVISYIYDVENRRQIINTWLVSESMFSILFTLNKIVCSFISLYVMMKKNIERPTRIDSFDPAFRKVASSFSETLYREIASLHVWHSLKNRPYDNILFSKMIANMWNLSEKFILEFGCWHGHYANFLLECWGQYVYGVDIDDEAIKTAQSNNTKWWHFIHLSKDWIEHISTLWVSFDEVYSMYVYETIKDKNVIAKIFSDIYLSLKEWGVFQFIIGNLEEFYWKKCIEFEFPVDPNIPTLQDGDPYVARLLAEDWFFDVQDFYYSHDTLVALLQHAWFQDVSIQKHSLCWDEYTGMIDEKDFSPSVIFVAKK